MRRGMTLIELIVTIPLIVAVLTVMASFFPKLLTDIPKIQRAAHVHRGLAHMLRTVQTDVDTALALPESFGDKTAGESVLLIRLPDGVIFYEVNADGIVRNELSGADGEGTRTNSWSLPAAKVSFQLWEREGEVSAVAVRTAVALRVRGRNVDKLANTQVYFLSALPSVRETP